MRGLRRRADPEGRGMGTWSPERMRFAALSLVAAALTGTLWLALGGSVPLAGIYVALAGAALLLPAGITVQVMAGQALVGSLLLGSGAPHPLLLVPVVACVVGTAELLAVVARLDSPLWCHAGDALARAGVSSAVGGGLFGVVVLVSSLRGPGGFLAVVLASGACAAVGVGLARLHRDPGRRPDGSAASSM